jgi:hypothetical protein
LFSNSFLSDVQVPSVGPIRPLFLLIVSLSRPICRCRAELFLDDENEASNHDLVLTLRREDSFVERGIKERLDPAHAGHTESSPIFRIVALQKHD